MYIYFRNTLCPANKQSYIQTSVKSQLAFFAKVFVQIKHTRFMLISEFCLHSVQCQTVCITISSLYTKLTGCWVQLHIAFKHKNVIICAYHSQNSKQKMPNYLIQDKNKVNYILIQVTVSLAALFQWVLLGNSLD